MIDLGFVSFKDIAAYACSKALVSTYTNSGTKQVFYRHSVFFSAVVLLYIFFIGFELKSVQSLLSDYNACRY